MANIKNAKMQIADGPSPGNKKITVSFKLAFSAAEANKTYRYDIKLRSEDKPGDDEGFRPSQVLYDFRFDGSTSTRKITSQAGEKSFSHSRIISRATLNEDPGADIDTSGHPSPKIHFHPDEVFAEIILKRGDQIVATVDTARSATQDVLL